MVWAIVLAVLGAISQAVTMWLGFHITASPEIVLNTRKVFWYRFTFAAMLLLSLAVTATTAWRGTTVETIVIERAHFATTDIRAASKPEWPLVGEQLAANFSYKNVGNGTAYNMVAYGRTALEPDYSSYSEAQAIEEFEKWLKALPPSEGTSQAKESELWSTARGAILTPEDLENIASGRKVMYIVAVIRFRDDIGKHTQRICKFLQPPEPTRSRSVSKFGILSSCSRYNDEIEGWLTGPTS